MSDKPVWMETWAAHPACAVVRAEPGVSGVVAQFGTDDIDRTHLAAAAPSLVRALLAVEWKGPQIGRVRHCSACGGAERHDHDYNSDRLGGPSCSLDAALTAAGFPTQDSRDEARKLMAAK